MVMKNKMSDYQDDSKLNFIYRGVVEDRFDPELKCRCKIRVLGVHDEFRCKDPLFGIPTEELPWAEPAFGLYEGSISGNGEWSVPLQGSHVWVFFENGNWMQPRFFASIPGMPEYCGDDPGGCIGFTDPGDEWPSCEWKGEEDPSRYHKKWNLAKTSLLEIKLPNIDIVPEIAVGGNWTEHPPMYQALYPFNNVKHSHTGIYTETDDTEGNRRWHIYHPSNSYIEIGEIGQMVIRNAEKRWDICDDMKFEHVMNDSHRMVDTNRTSLVLLDEWQEIRQTKYTMIHIDDRKDVYGKQEYYVVDAHILYLEGERSKWVGANDIEWIIGAKETYVTEDVVQYYDLNRFNMVAGDDIYHCNQMRHSFVSEEDKMECEGTIIIRAGEEIILEAPIITFRGGVFNDFMEATNIAETFSWGGLAYGISEYALLAEEAGLATPGVVTDTVDEYVINPEAATAPAPPDIPMPTEPVPPPDIPTPPAPPAPPALDYNDGEKVKDEC